MMLRAIASGFRARAERRARIGASRKAFAAFKAELWPDAQAKGISRATFDLAMSGVTPDNRVIAATKRQPEYGKPVGDYINAIASKAASPVGERKARQRAKLFDAVEKKFGVERWVLLALWGMETDYGAAKDRLGRVPLAGDACLCRLSPSLFPQRADRRHAHHAGRPLSRASKMVSSWAGAMGQTQFMPSNVVDYAIDFSGDGKRRHLEQCARRHGLHRQLSAQVALAARPALGL